MFSRIKFGRVLIPFAALALLFVLVLAVSEIAHLISGHHDTLSPQTAPNSSAAVATCDYYYQDVTVKVVGVAGSGVNGSGCAAVMQPMVNHVGGVWRSQTLTNVGDEFAQLGQGSVTVHIYSAGTSGRPLAGRTADYFQAAGWHPEVPS